MKARNITQRVRVPESCCGEPLRSGGEIATREYWRAAGHPDAGGKPRILDRKADHRIRTRQLRNRRFLYRVPTQGLGPHRAGPIRSLAGFC
mgnify:CR=1 FL=1